MGYGPVPLQQPGTQPSMPFQGASYPPAYPVYPACSAYPAYPPYPPYPPYPAYYAQPFSPYPPAYPYGPGGRRKGKKAYNPYGLYGDVYAAPPASHTKLTAGLLSIFLGILGMQNFYLGRYGWGIAQVMITVVGAFFFFIGPAVNIIWGIVQGILILTSKKGSFWHRDARGLELVD